MPNLLQDKEHVIDTTHFSCFTMHNTVYLILSVIIFFTMHLFYSSVFALVVYLFIYFLFLVWISNITYLCRDVYLQSFIILTTILIDRMLCRYISLTSLNLQKCKKLLFYYMLLNPKTRSTKSFPEGVIATGSLSLCRRHNPEGWYLIFGKKHSKSTTYY